MSIFKKTIKTEAGHEMEVMHDPECKICIATDVATKEELRGQVDQLYLDGDPNNYIKRIQRFLEAKGYPKVASALVTRHFKRHSPYVMAARNYALRVVKEGAAAMGSVKWDADDVIQEIINIGGDKIKYGEMEVGEKLLIAALKEQGSRKKFGTIQDMLSGLNKQRFIEGEIVEDKVPTNGE